MNIQQEANQMNSGQIDNGYQRNSARGKPLASRLFTILISGLCLLLAAACTSKPRNQDADIDALLWSTASAEYDVIVQQIFFQARSKLSVLSQSRGTAALEQNGDYVGKPLAIIVDVDDTLLSNGALHYQLLAQGKQFNAELWADWIDQARAKPIAGALEYVNYATKLGITVFYVSNRDISHMDGTWRNLTQLGFPLDENKQQLLMLNGDETWGWDKGSRRAHIAENYRVIQIIGDGLGDFISGTGAMNLFEQREASAKHMSFWGERWFMLPNPVYGDWETAILKGGDMKTPSTLEPIRAKYHFIRGGESQGVW